MNKPENKHKIGAFECAVWNNERTVNGKQVSYKSVSFTKNYKDKNDVWQKQTINLKQSDLRKAAALLSHTANTLDLLGTQ